MRSLKGRDIGTLENGDRVAVVSSESEKSRIVPLHDISRWEVKIPTDVVLGTRKVGKDKNLETGERSHHRSRGRSKGQRGGGGATTTRSGDGKDAGAGKGSSIGSIISFYFEGEFHERSQRRRGRW